MVLISASNGFPSPGGPSLSARAPLDLFTAYSRVDNIQIYRRDTHPFYRMFNLVTNFDKMSNTDYVQYALVSVLELQRIIIYSVIVMSKVMLSFHMIKKRKNKKS